MSKKFTERYERAQDFLRFLKTENVTVSGKRRSELKAVFDVNYRSYRKQIYPEENWLDFTSVLETLFNRKEIFYSDDNKLCLKVEFKQKLTSKTKNTSEGLVNSSIAAASTSTGELRNRKNMVKLTPLSVDQYLTKPKDKPKEEDMANGIVGHCTLCDVTYSNEQTRTQHLNGRRHRVNKLKMALKNNREYLCQDKGGVKVIAVAETLPETNSEKVILEIQEGRKSEVTFKLVNDNPGLDVHLIGCEMLSICWYFSLGSDRLLAAKKTTVLIPPKHLYRKAVQIKPGKFGSFHSPIVFYFKSNGKNFHIVRFVYVTYISPLLEELKPKSPYRKPVRVSGKEPPDIETLDGRRPDKFISDGLEKTIPLDSNVVPRQIRKLINHGLNMENQKGLSSEDMERLNDVNMILDQPLSMATYEKHFSLLLNCEEVQLEVDIRRYDMDGVTMEPYPGNNSLLLLQVPGLAEKRPSILKKDIIFAQIKDSEGTRGNKQYRGHVHEVRETKVALSFHKSLLQVFVPNMKFYVRFTVGRLPLMMEYRAVKLADELSLKDMLFPEPHTACTRSTIVPLNEPIKHLFDRNIRENPQQFQAVQNILAGASRPAPYIIFGPPGTGKTVTLVEAIKQVVSCIPSAHVLACAPSNSAADVITERLLHHLDSTSVFRMMAASRLWKGVPDSIKKVCNYNKSSQEFYFPPKSEVMKYRVVVCTLITAGRLVSASFPPDHFTHVLIDEAGNASEPENIVPIAGILEGLPQVKDGGQLVLAGDPKQLGPIIRSPWALKYDLDMSLLERLMTDSKLYTKKGGDSAEACYTLDSKLITKLLKNYRSHPKILENPNKRFYGGELIACADEMLTRMFCKWDWLPKKDFPIIFHGVAGKDQREERSPSFFNPQEVVAVTDYVEELLKSKYKVKPKNIGVITPYMKQVQKIRQVFIKKNWLDVKVGSVEEFQGDERNVIIISTVRSQEDYLEHDTKFNLGFITNPKRFNVAITRSRALLIVIGNPNILKGDRCWKSFLDFCVVHGGYKGVHYDDDSEEMEEIIKRFAAVSLTESNMTPEEVSESNDLPINREV